MIVRGRGQCEKHQLPLDARGECELCRLSAIPSKPPPSRSTPWLVIVAAFLLVAVGVVLMARSSESPPPPRGVSPPSSAAPGAPAREALQPDPVEKIEHTSSGRAEAAPPPIPIPPRPTGGDDPTPTTAPVPPAPAQQGDATRFTEGDAKKALEAVRIEMYATSWCGSCRSAREYLDFNGIAYTEYDIDVDSVAKARLAELNPRQSIPTFKIDEIVQIGFSPESLEHKLNEAVRRRLEEPAR